MVVVLFGYGLSFFGWQVWEGCNPNLIDVFWPGKYTKCSGGSASQNTVPNASVSTASTAGGTLTTGQVSQLDRSSKTAG